MRPLLILPLLAACGTTLIAPASADIRDTQFHVEGASARIWISFDNQPTDVALTPTTDGVRLDVRGIDARPHQIEPRNRGLITSLEVIPVGAGAQLNIAATGYWADARVELRQGGVLLHVSLDAESAGPRPESSDAANRMALAQLNGEPVEYAANSTSHPTSTSEPVARDREPTPIENSTPAHHELSTPAEVVEEGASDPGAALAELANSDAPAVSTPVAEAAPEPVAPPPEPEVPCLAEAAFVEEDPWDDARLISHAACLRDAGEIEDAANIYQQMLAFEPENFDIAMELATIRRTQGNDGAARALFDQAASNATSDAEAVRARARIREIQNQ
jgi:hypothetical protein